METKPQPSPRNLQTKEKHRKEVFWQITFPLIFGGLVVIAGCILLVMVVSKGNDISVGADMSLVFVLIPTMLMGIIPLAILAGMAFGVIKLIQVLPPLFFKLQQGLKTVSAKLTTVSDKAASPFINAEGVKAMIKTLFGGSRKQNKTNQERG